MNIVALVSTKGGVGRTTVTANLAVALGRAGRSVLAVDLDPQNALRLHFGLDPHGIGGCARATLAQGDWREACVPTAGGVVVLPYGAVNDGDRLGFEHYLDTHPDALAGRLQALGLPPDTVVLLDTPPGPSAGLRQALDLAHLALVVTLPDAAAYATLPATEALIQRTCGARPGFRGHHYLVNQTDSSRLLAADVVQVMRQRFGARILGTVHSDQAVCEALAHGQNVFDYAADSCAADDFAQAAKAIVQLMTGSGRSAP